MPSHSANRIKRRYWRFRAFFYARFRSLPVAGSLEEREISSAAALLQAANIGNNCVTLFQACGENLPLPKLPANAAVGIDWSPELLQKARVKQPQAQFAAADVKNLPFPDRIFDMIVALGLTEYLAAPDEWLAEAHRVLKPEGLLLFSSAYPNMLNNLRRIWNPRLYLRRRVYWDKAAKNWNFRQLSSRKLPFQEQFLWRRSE